MHHLAVTEQGTQVHAEGNLLVLKRGKAALRQVKIGEIEQVLLFGRVELSSGAVALAARRGVDVVWLTLDGRFRARLATRASRNVPLRLAQYRATIDAAFCLRMARAIVLAKIRHQRAILLRAQRRLADDALAVVLGQMRLLVHQAEREDSLDALRGFEGQAAALYFSQFGKLLRAPEFTFAHRTRRPPRDPVNACLSFGYAVLGSLAESEVQRCGLDPALGFFHQPLYGRSSLTLDLIEEFRPLVDGLVLRVINRRQLAAGDFERRGAASVEEILAGDVAEFARIQEGDQAADGVAESATIQVAGATDDDGQASETGADRRAGGVSPLLIAPGSDSFGADDGFDDHLAAPPAAAVEPVAADAAGADGGQASETGADRRAGGVSPLLIAPSSDSFGADDGFDDHLAAPPAAAVEPVPTDSAGEGGEGVYLADTGRRIFLAELFRRMRERMYYAPRQGALELREILRRQAYHLARVVEGREAEYIPFVPE